jgi:hypothetical protein
VRIADVPVAENRTCHLPNTSLDRYYCTNLLSVSGFNLSLTVADN